MIKSRFSRESAAVPKLVQFESNQDEYNRLDELQALNTALCFLCSVNADVKEVHSFLTAHPEALLLEGTSRLVEESASYILLSRRCSCSQSSNCQANRGAVLNECLSHDFLHYREQQKDGEDHSSKYSQWQVYRQDLVLIEQDIRQWRRTEASIRQQCLELSVSKIATPNQKQKHWTCSGSRKRVCDERIQQERRLTMTVLKERHSSLLAEIRRARQLQFRLLKLTFKGIQRHVCATKKAASSS